MSNSLKKILLDKCLQLVETQIASAQKSIDEAQIAANEETKSSAGDKYETTRAMMQIEIENNTKRMSESQKLQQTLSKINLHEVYEQVGLGSLVLTNQGKFFIAVGLGKIDVEGQSFFVISPNSPIGEKLHHQTKGFQFLLNGKSFMIEGIE